MKGGVWLSVNKSKASGASPTCTGLAVTSICLPFVDTCKGNTQKLCCSTKLCCLSHSAKPLLRPAKPLHFAKLLLRFALHTQPHRFALHTQPHRSALCIQPHWFVHASAPLCLVHPTALVCTRLPTAGLQDPEDPFSYGSTFIYYYCITSFHMPLWFPLYVPSPAWDPHPFLFRSPARCVDYVVYYFIIY